MNPNDLQGFVESLCADEYSKLCSILKSNGDSVLSSKVSNHKIIHRERTQETMHSCPLCGSVRIVKNGHTKTKRQKYYCKDCNKNFSDTTNTIAYRSRKSYKEWSEFISDTLDQKSLRKTAELIGISTTTAFSWRHKLLSTLSTYKKDSKNNLSSKIEADGPFFT